MDIDGPKAQYRLLRQWRARGWLRVVLVGYICRRGLGWFGLESRVVSPSIACPWGTSEGLELRLGLALGLGLGLGIKSPVVSPSAAGPWGPWEGLAFGLGLVLGSPVVSESAAGPWVGPWGGPWAGGRRGQ